MSIYWTIGQSAGSLFPTFLFFEKCVTSQAWMALRFLQVLNACGLNFHSRFFEACGKLKRSNLNFRSNDINSIVKHCFHRDSQSAGFSFHPKGHQTLRTSSKRHRRRQGHGVNLLKTLRLAPSGIAGGDGEVQAGLQFMGSKQQGF